MYDGFRQIITSFNSGIRLISTFVVLLLAMFYCAVVIAHYAFQDINEIEPFSEDLNFSTLGDSVLVMYQVQTDAHFGPS